MRHLKFMPSVAFLIWFVLSGLVNQLIASEATLLSYRRTVGPPVMFAPAEPRPFADQKGRLIVVNWNVHAGHGDIEELIDKISGAEQANGFGKPEFVLLLQESFRQGNDIPVSTGIKVPRRIAPPDPNVDIEDIAGKLGWWMLYAPSMRNGNSDGEKAEDRGNAVLSSLPLGGVEAVELPFGVQRRVALIATISDHHKQPRLRVG